MRRFLCQPLLILSPLVLSASFMACGPPEEEPVTDQPDQGIELSAEELASLRADVHNIIQTHALKPVEKPDIPAAKVELGQNLFFDSIISGNKDTSCGTCHRPLQGTVDGVSLPAGTKARLDPMTGARYPGPELEYMPRNVPDLFNRGHQDIRTFFWDTRLQKVERDGEEQFVIYDRLDGYSPGNIFRQMDSDKMLEQMHAVPENLLAAQNMMPILNRDELRGAIGDTDVCGEPNQLANFENFDPESVWNALMARLMEIPAYQELFANAYPDVPTEHLSLVHAANAISAFIIDSYTLTNSPWDRFLRGEEDALEPAALRGAKLFYGKAACSTCHSGDLFTDQEYYNIGVAPMGSGPGSRVSTTRKIDRGVAHRSLASQDESFKFRTPPLRNVEVTGPYMHTGGYNTLKDVLRHKNNAMDALWTYNVMQLRPEFQAELHRQKESFEAVESTMEPLFQSPLHMTEEEMDDLVAFLESLTSPEAHDLSYTAPESVASGLPINIPMNPNIPSETGYALDLDVTEYCAARAEMLANKEEQ